MLQVIVVCVYVCKPLHIQVASSAVYGQTILTEVHQAHSPQSLLATDVLLIINFGQATCTTVSVHVHVTRFYMLIVYRIQEE